MCSQRLKISNIHLTPLVHINEIDGALGNPVDALSRVFPESQ